MRGVFGLVLLVGMGLAGFAVYMVQDFVSQQEYELAAERERAASAVVTTKVYAPVRAMTYGEQLNMDDVILIPYAQEFLPEGVFRTEEDLFPLGPNEMRVVTRPMEINEPILASKVTDAGARPGITALLDRGMRAFPIPDDITRQLGDELRPTDRVDIFWTGSVGSGGQITKLIKSRLEVIAVDDAQADGRGGGGGVVLQVSPEDFAALTLAQSSGRISMTLVGSNDDTILDENLSININTAVGIAAEVQKAAPVVEAAPEKCYRTERRGTERVQIETPCIDQ